MINIRLVNKWLDKQTIIICNRSLELAGNIIKLFYILGQQKYWVPLNFFISLRFRGIPDGER